MIRKLFISVLLMLLAFHMPWAEIGATSDLSTLVNRKIPFPQVPDTLKPPVLRASYIIEHFWDSLDFKNDPLALERQPVEQHFSDFIAVSELADSLSRTNAFQKLVIIASTNDKALKLILDLSEKYLYHTDSPMFDEDKFAIFLQTFVELDSVSEENKIRPKALLEAIASNHPGNRATDFVFKTLDGAEMSLYEIETRDKLLLVFYDPECDHCHEVMKRMFIEPCINEAISSGQLKVAAVYSGDEFDVWREQASLLPHEWTTGYEDGTIQEGGLYFLRTMPTLYLLDNNKNVLLKDSTIEKIVGYLSARD